MVCKSWNRKIARQTGALPSSFLLTGVKRTSDFPLAGGGFADIYIGKYAGRDVALKVLRLFEGEEEKKKQKVCLLNPVLTDTECEADFLVGNLT